MQAAFVRRAITPPLGTRMMGFGLRDLTKGCESIHDDVYCRTLYLAHGQEQALIVGFDMCFIGKDDAFRLKGALGTAMGFEARQVLLNASHSHAGPASGRWYAGDFLPPNHVWLNELQGTVLEAAQEARDLARPVRLFAGVARSRLPMNRRHMRPDGEVVIAPNPEGPTCDLLPVLQMLDESGKVVCLLFSVSAHPSACGGWAISADYPGVAMDRLDQHLGAVASMFLQGCGGDAKTSVAGAGAAFRQDHWPDVVESGEMVASEVTGALQAGLDPVEPDLHCVLRTTRWPLGQPLPRSGYEGIAGGDDQTQAQWARRQIYLLERHGRLPDHWPILIQGMQLGNALRLLALEGEPVAEHGLAIARHYAGGVTFPLGYSTGEGAYLVASAMLAEGGMEPTSYWEYGLPSPLAPGTESVLHQALQDLDAEGIH